MESQSARQLANGDRPAPVNAVGTFSYRSNLQDLPAAAIAGLASGGSPISTEAWLKSASPAEKEKFLSQPVVRAHSSLEASSSSLSHLVECITSNQELFSSEIGEDGLGQHQTLPMPYSVLNGTRGGVADSKSEVRLATSSLPSMQMKKPAYPCFPSHNMHDFKHVLYNLTAEAHNDTSGNTFLQPVTMSESGRERNGFRFNKNHMPEKKLPELYAQHIRKSRLDLQDQNSVFIQDLYKFYLRACVELLSKYFEKRDKWTYLYDEVPLFIPGETLDEAQNRLKSLQTRARKRSKKSER